MKKIILAILDGIGARKIEHGNAYVKANTPCLDRLKDAFPHSLLEASGQAVGLPDGKMGNSEVGHLTIGSGRINYQSLERINQTISKEIFNENYEFNQAIAHAKQYNSKLHILGLLSDGGVHSDIHHILALIKLAKKKEVKDLYIHVFTDGRDTLPDVCMNYIDQLEQALVEQKIGKIATVSGRYYAMDREGMWDKTKIAYDALVNGIGKTCDDIEAMIKESYSNQIYDEFIVPTIIDKNGLIEDDDALIVANYRPDRLTQTFSAITNPEFYPFPTKHLKNLYTVTMMPCSDLIISKNAFPLVQIDNTLGEVLSKNNYKSLRITEHSKYPHITHFFDGDKDIDLANTDKIKIPREEVDTYDLAPKMKAREITSKIIKTMNNYDFIIVNYANGDMLGHTGNIPATIEGIEEIDDCIKNLFVAAQAQGFTLIITADHGNCEEMLTPTDIVLTSHTTNPVNLIVCNPKYNVKDGGLADIAPSILNMLEIDIPKDMTGNVIIEEKE